MKRFSLLVAAVAACGVFASVASAAPARAHHAASVRAAATSTTFEAEYNASEFFGAVKCHGKENVNNRFPGGKDVETCETTEGQLKRVVAGKGQTGFEQEGGTIDPSWTSDFNGALQTTNFTYSVNKKLTRFKLVAIYPAPM